MDFPFEVPSTGRRGWSSDLSAPLRDSEGRIIGVIGTVRDITDRKANEKALEEGAYFFRESQRAAAIGSYKTDFVVGLWESSEVLDEIFGINRDYERTVANWLAIVHPDDREMMSRYLQEEVIGRHQPFNMEYRIRHPSDGEVRWVLGLGKVQFDAAGGILSMIGTIQDITERRLAEDSLHDLNERFRAIATNTPDHIIMQDAELRYTAVINPQLGLSQEDMIGKTDFDFLDRQDAEKLMRIKREVLETRLPRHMVSSLRNLLGELEYFDGTYVPKVDSHGGIEGLIGYFRNVTERKAAEERIEGLLREKELILKEVHHRVKNNMNGVFNLLAMQAEALPDLPVKAILEDAASRVRSMGLLYSKLYQSETMGRLSLRDYLVDLVDELIEVFPHRTRIAVVYDIEDIVLSQVKLSPLGLIVNELTTNAIKHAFADRAEGSIEIHAATRAGRLGLRFRDDGIGMTRDATAPSGGGFGLELVRLLVAQLGGDLALEVGGGTTISISISV